MNYVGQLCWTLCEKVPQPQGGTIPLCLDGVMLRWARKQYGRMGIGTGGCYLLRGGEWREERANGWFYYQEESALWLVRDRGMSSKFGTTISPNLSQWIRLDFYGSKVMNGPGVLIIKELLVNTHTTSTIQQLGPPNIHFASNRLSLNLRDICTPVVMTRGVLEGPEKKGVKMVITPKRTRS